MSISPARAAALVAFVAVAAFLNSLGNGFAFDDNWFIVQNTVVTEGDFVRAFTESSWPGAFEGTGNYRPFTLTSFAIEWSLWGPSPLGFHVVNVMAHTVVSLLVLALLLRFVPIAGALAGALLFAVHPVHVEAVANTMGRAELYAAAAYLGACLVCLGWRPAADRARAVRMVAVLGLFTLGLGSKEIAVTLPAGLVLIAWSRTFSLNGAGRDVRAEIRRDVPLFAAAFALLALFVVVRWTVLGTATGANTTPGMQSIGTYERLLTALAVWPHYMRLLLVPIDLVADYSPAVILLADSITAGVVLGTAILAGLLFLAFKVRRAAPVVSLGIAWFLVTISPVSNLVVRSDVVLAERTLYLPSVGLALVVAGLVHAAMESSRTRLRGATLALVAVAFVGFTVRTVARNPTWSDTFSVMSTLAEEHPESWRSQWTYAVGQARVGDLEAAAQSYELARRLAPDHYQLLVEIGVFEAERGRPQTAELRFGEAIRVLPDFAGAYRRLAEARIGQERYRDAHSAVLQGLAAAGPDRELFALLSETYIAKGDLDAAVRAREAALGQEPDNVHDWGRLADIRAAQGRPDLEAEARRRARLLSDSRGGA